MSLNILLLDCSKKIKEKITKQGYKVSEGTVGFCNGIRKFPTALYEQDIFIYNPAKIKKDGNSYLDQEEIKNLTPEFELDDIREHLCRGALLLVFVNNLSNDQDVRHTAYNWIPYIPSFENTKDFQPLSVNLNIPDYLAYNYVSPLLNLNDIKKPILNKLTSLSNTNSIKTFPLIYNRNNNILSCFIEYNRGLIFILPQYEDNEEIINIFLNRIVPKIYKFNASLNVIDQFISPEQQQHRKKLESAKTQINTLEAKLEQIMIDLNESTRKKENIIKNDETAVLIVNYYDLALQQEDVALFYLYKVIEALERKLGGEKEAKNQLGNNEEWNLIGKVANVSYGDIRHAPKPGEKIKEWNQEDIKKCFDATEKIIYSYFNTLF